MNNPLLDKIKAKNIILASGSPRRQELLKGLDIPFSILTKEVEEIYPEHLQAGEITAYLANLKATVFTDLNANDIVITADTIVWSNGKAVMKPKSKEDAIRIISDLSNSCHEVYTSVCLKSKDKIKVFTDVTKVCFKELTRVEIAYYVAMYKPYDKAGGYGAQDWIGFIGIDRIEGSYYNVMGFPVHKLYKELINF